MVEAKNTYQVTAKRWRLGWEVVYQGDVVTQSRTLTGVPQEFSDWMETDTGEPFDGDVAVHCDLDGVEQLVDATRVRLEDARADLDAAARDWRVLAHRLHTDEALSVRDTAAVMDVSPGRVSQLVKAARHDDDLDDQTTEATS